MTRREVYLLGWRGFRHQVSSQANRYETLGINHHGVFVYPTAVFLSFCSFDRLASSSHQGAQPGCRSQPQGFLSYPSGCSVPSANMQLPEIAKNFEPLIISSTIAVAAPIPQGTSVRAGDDSRINFTSTCYQAILLSSFSHRW